LGRREEKREAHRTLTVSALPPWGLFAASLSLSPFLTFTLYHFLTAQTVSGPTSHVTPTAPPSHQTSHVLLSPFSKLTSHLPRLARFRGAVFHSGSTLSAFHSCQAFCSSCTF